MKTLLIDHDVNAETLRADALKCTKRRPPYITVHALIGQGFNGQLVRASLAKARALSRGVVVWVRIPFAQLDAGTVDLTKIHLHPSIAELVAILHEHVQLDELEAPILIDYLGELTNTKEGSNAWRLVNPKTAKTTYNNLALRFEQEQLPLRPAVCFEPHCVNPPGDVPLDKWVESLVPEVAVARRYALSIHRYGLSSITGAPGAACDALEAFAVQHGMALRMHECAAADGPTDPVAMVKLFVKPVVQRVLERQYEAVQLVVNKVATGYPTWQPVIRWAPGIGLPLGAPPWPGAPLVGHALETAYALPEFVTLESLGVP